MASGQFIYPRDSDANVDFQYLDLVNVSWTASGLGNLDSVALTLYLMSNGESGNYQVRQSTLSASASHREMLSEANIL